MANRPLVLSIDAGTTWCKAAYTAPDGRFVAEGRVYARDDLPFGHGPEDLQAVWDSVTGAVRQATEQLETAPSPAAIAISARKAPGIWLDADGEAIGVPVDSVARAGREDIDECFASGIWRGPGPFAYGYGIDLIGNTRWLRRVHSGLWERASYGGNLHAWLLRKLTGRWITSPAGGPVQPRWPDEVMELTGLPVSVYPSVVLDTGRGGGLLREAAVDLSLPAGTLVVAGTHDGAAANLGVGAVEPGDACLTLGTNGVLRAVTGDRLPGRFGYTITGDRWALVRDLPELALHLDGIAAAITGSGNAISPETHEQLTREASRAPVGSGGLRIPVRDEGYDARAVVQHARDSGDADGEIYRATLEGVAFAFLELFEYAERAGARPRRLVATGGGVNNALLLRIISAVLERPIGTHDLEAGLLGAAMLAAVGAGWYPDISRAIEAMLPPFDVFTSEPDIVSAYRDLRGTFETPQGWAPGDRFAGQERP